MAANCKERHKKGCGISFHLFPVNAERRKMWEIAVHREGWKPSSTDRLCSKHFQTGKPSPNPDHPDFVPTIFVREPLPRKNAASPLKKVPRKRSSNETKAARGLLWLRCGVAGQTTVRRHISTTTKERLRTCSWKIEVV